MGIIGFRVNSSRIGVPLAGLEKLDRVRSKAEKFEFPAINGGWTSRRGLARKFSLSLCLPLVHPPALYIRGVSVSRNRRPNAICSRCFNRIRTTPRLRIRFHGGHSIVPHLYTGRTRLKRLNRSNSAARSLNTDAYKPCRKKDPAPECPVLEPFHETGQRSIILFAFGLIEPRKRGS